MNKSMMQATRQEDRSYDFQALYSENRQHLSKNSVHDFQSSMHMGDFIDDSSLQSVVQKHRTCTQVSGIPCEIPCSQGPQFTPKIGVMDISSYQSCVTKYDEDFGSRNNDVVLPVASQAYIKSADPEDSCRWNAYCKTSLPVSHSPEITQRTDVGSSITSSRKISDGYVDPYSSMAISAASDKESALMEPTDLSSAYGSLNTIKHSSVDWKRKRCNVTDGIDLESEDSYTDVVATKKAHRVRSDRPKRTREAETHNQSERRRRGKINEKLRALQELIPNSNKTDKASLLTETIKYLRKLRQQLQILSHYPNGITQSQISELMLHGEVSHVDNRLDFGKQNIGLNAVWENLRNTAMSTVVGSSSPTLSAQIRPSSRVEIAHASSEPPVVSSFHTLPSSEFGDSFRVN